MTMRRSSWRMTALAMVLFVMGCEAPLVLDHVKTQRGATTQRYDLFQAAATNGGAIVIVGSGGVIVTSADQGATWTRRQLAGAPFLLDVAHCPDGRFVALAAERQVWIGDTEAAAWEAAPIDTSEAVQAIACDPRGRLWVIGSFSTIWSSDDSGQTWSETSMDEDMHLTTIHFVDENIGFITGEFGDVLRTQDGGASWENLTPLPDEFYPQATHFADAQNGWVVGLNGTIWKTTDGGATWNLQPTGTTAPLYGIAANGAGLFAVGGFGTLLTTDSAGNWSGIDHGQPIRFYLRAILPLDAHRVVVAGGAGALFVIET